MLEIWRAGGANFGASPREAEAIEAQGWDGQMFMDSQCLSADPWAQMGVWASATARLLLSTGVTNPLTRNLAVTAGAAVTVQAISGGRAVLGIGRGDSAHAYLGHAPVGTRRFERALVHLQTLLSGGQIPFKEYGPSGDAPPLDALHMGERPQAVRLNWMPADLPKVPLDVAATGPKVIAMGARLAERVTFSVGASRERLGWALDVARNAVTEGAPEPSYGAQIVVVCDTDRAAALDMAMRIAPPLARFQVIEGRQVGPQDAEAARNLDAVSKGYDMTRHSDMGASDRIAGGSLSPDFVRRFAVVGTPDEVIAQLVGLRAMGIERFVVVGPGLFAGERAATQDALFISEVMPALRKATA
jgi:5,10-methylenetetrahydromethanopterin reductase